VLLLGPVWLRAGGGGDQAVQGGIHSGKGSWSAQSEATSGMDVALNAEIPVAEYDHFNHL
jgi:hypothetical protein